MSKEERKIVSYHEVGHALISALQKNSEPVQKITIVPRTMGTLGYVLSYPEEEKFTQTEKELRAELVSLFGGRAAESIVFDTVTTGASNDIEKATKIARAMVTRFGMSKRFGLIGLETVESQYLDHRAALNCADETAAAIDEEVMKILKESYKEAKKLLKENRQIMDKIADYLIKKETITGHEFMEIFCREKGIPMPKKDKGEESLKKLRKDREASEGDTRTATENIQVGSGSGADTPNRNFSMLGAGMSSMQNGGLLQMPVNTGSAENQSTIGTKLDIAVGDKTDSSFLSQKKSAAEDPESGEASGKSSNDASESMLRGFCDTNETADKSSNDAKESMLRGFCDTDETADKSSHDAKESAGRGSVDTDESAEQGAESMSESEKKYASMLKNRRFQPEDDKPSS